MSARTGVKELGLSSRSQTLELSMPPRLRSHAVTVVPTFAPMMTLMACRSVISPELTKPTTMTVTPRPVRKPTSGLPVIWSSSERSLLPARRSSAEPIRLMPNKNSDKPPSIVRKSKISIFHPSFVSLSLPILDQAKA